MQIQRNLTNYFTRFRIEKINTKLNENICKRELCLLKIVFRHLNGYLVKTKRIFSNLNINKFRKMKKEYDHFF